MVKLRKNPLSVEALTFKNQKDKIETEKFYWLEMEDIVADRYVISTVGRIFDMENERELPIQYNDSFARVCLRTVDGQYKSVSLNRLVAFCFVKKSRTDLLYGRDAIHTINWKDNDHRYTNLEWVNSIELGILTDWKKGKQSKDDEVRYICRMLKAGYTITEIIDFLPFPVGKAEIINIKTRATHTDISRHYKW